MECRICNCGQAHPRQVKAGWSHSLTAAEPLRMTYRDYPICDSCWLDPSRYRGGVDETSQRIARG